MRTTLTIDDDVAQLLHREIRRSGEPLKQAVNRLLRRGLQPPVKPVEIKPFVVTPIHARLPVEWTSGSVQELLNLLQESAE